MLKKLLMFALCLCLLVSGLSMTAFAGENTTYTYTVSVDRNWIRTQDAYMSGSVYLNGFGLTAPRDMFYFGRELYIADTGNARLVVFNIDSGATRILGEGILEEPSGIFVDTDGTIYVADSKIPAVVILNQQGEEQWRIERPTNFLFNELSVFEPKNVVVTSQGNIFVAGYGSYQGLMQFDRKGEFQGYFAANKRGLSPFEALQEKLLGEKAKENLLNRIPRAIQNIDLADRDMIYSVTQDENKAASKIGSTTKIENYLKKHNMTGLNILSRGGSMTEEWNFTDVAMGNDGNVYALTQSGLLFEYDYAGNLVFSFGGRAVSTDRLGLFTKAVAVDVDETGIIYVLDEERSVVQTFFPTEFTLLTHKAVNDLESGNYATSLETWSDLLKLNGNSSIAHLGYGKTLMYQGDYKGAMEHFKICDNKEYYSQAFWEIRSRWLNENILYVFLVLIIVVVAAYVVGFLKKKGIIKVKEKVAKKKGKFAQEIENIKNMIRHPLDSYYEIKIKRRGSILSATIIYIIAFVVFVLDLLGRGYLYSAMDIRTAPITLIPFIFFIPLGLWIFGNNMIASINEGEGTFRSVYISSAYMFAPYLLFTPAAVICTYVLSLNESFIVTILWLMGVVWTGVLLFIAVMEIHNYTFGEVVKNILLILFFMIMAVITFVILYLIWTQVVAFVGNFISEGVYRIFGV